MITKLHTRDRDNRTGVRPVVSQYEVSFLMLHWPGSVAMDEHLKIKFHCPNGAGSPFELPAVLVQHRRWTRSHTVHIRTW